MSYKVLRSTTAAFVLSIAMAGPLMAQVPQPEPAPTQEGTSTLQNALERVSFDALLSRPLPFPAASGPFQEISGALWKKYLSAVTEDPRRVEALKKQELTDGDKTMRFSLDVIGEKPAQGYPLYIALHGGGTAPDYVNDGQWNDMKSYYRGSVETGIYVATRGVTDTWNLHFVDESYRLYDQLIETLVAFHNVDPNRVYLVGFSAGGDGVYQIVPRMADRFAAANMSAGHHNWVTFDNLYRTPFLIQVGEYDSAYDRNKVAVQNALELTRLQNLRGGYVHDVFVHAQGSHNSWSDRDPSDQPNEILAAPAAWLENGDQSIVERKTNAVRWMNQFTRDPYPTTFYWDPTTHAPRTESPGHAYVSVPSLKTSLTPPKNLFYWLDLGSNPVYSKPFTIEASYDRVTNSVSLRSLGELETVRILLHPTMLDLTSNITVSVDGDTLGSVQVRPDLNVMTRTLLERGDNNYMFAAQITLVKSKTGVWTVLTPAAEENRK